MPDFASLLPGTEALKRGLARALRKGRLSEPSLTLLDREPTPYSTTFPCEIVKCRIGRGKPQQLFCKYTANVDYTGHGHRGGIAYETATYRHVLASVRRFRPRFYGGYVDPETGQHWLFLEYLDGSLPVGKLNDAAAMAKTARWIAEFQVASYRLLTKKRLGFLKRYDKEYYLGWVRRTFEFAPPREKRSCWLHLLCVRAADLLAPLLVHEPAIIHGEYYQHNILFHRGQICPVDWESAAVGEGLIDLASLTEAWGSKMVEVCTKAYVRTRWPAGAPAEFEKAFRAARLYLTFRWLGDDPEITAGPRAAEYWKQLRRLAAEWEPS
ncbi:MAG TPA: phosphotransferase [Candidatus Dormibacteraeota bacterium]|nr:phosphotransferase [Candidatus Dormibacteraeota bacterium]